MKSRKRIWIGALCLIAATVITLSLKVRPASAHASSVLTSTRPAAHLANASLRAEAIRNAELSAGDAQTPISGNQQTRTIFPPVEEYTLTPPNPSEGSEKSVLEVRFGPAAATLASQIPMMLGNQSVVLRRSADNPNTFVTSLDFDWQKFIEEQAQRKLAASQGRTVSVFDGRKFVRTERLQFLEPVTIESALRSHQSVQFSGGILLGSASVNVFPDHELMMTNLAVVEDFGDGSQQNPGRAFDQCITSGPQGNPSGAWTFNTLMLAMAGTTAQNPQPAEQMLLGMLNSWDTDQFVNNGAIRVLARPAMGQLNVNGQGAGLLGNWPVDSHTSCIGPNNACPSLTQAPVRLEAIVNRLDLGGLNDPFPPAGELRFVFTVTTDPGFDPLQGARPCHQSGGFNDVFNIILEYNVPSDLFPSPKSWAQVWNALPTSDFGEDYLGALQRTITDPIVKAGACGGSSCIAQIRTNEIMLAPLQGTNAGLWELREFHFNPSGPQLVEGTIAQTPDPSFNTTGTPACGSVNNNFPGLCAADAPVLSSYITTIATNPIFQRTNGAAPPVPNQWTLNGNTIAFLGGSALNNIAFWNDNNIGNNTNDVSRIDFSSNTCNGCHGKETNTGFQQIVNRLPGTQSNVSNFLAGCQNNSPSNPEDNCTPPSPGNQNPQCPLTLVNMGVGNPGECMETVPDPLPTGVSTQFGDLNRRVVYMQTVCGNGSNCQGGSSDILLLPFINKPIGVH